MNPHGSTEETTFQQALTFASADAHRDYLQGTYGGDNRLRARVQSLTDDRGAIKGFLADEP